MKFLFWSIFWGCTFVNVHFILVIWPFNSHLPFLQLHPWPVVHHLAESCDLGWGSGLQEENFHCQLAKWWMTYRLVEPCLRTWCTTLRNIQYRSKYYNICWNQQNLMFINIKFLFSNTCTCTKYKKVVDNPTIMMSSLATFLHTKAIICARGKNL